MLQTTLAAAAVFAVVMAAMAIGVLIGKRKIRGSCGGLANFRDAQGQPMCEACTDPSPECQGQAEAPDKVRQEA